MLPDEKKQKPEDSKLESDKDEESTHTSFRFLQMLGVPLPEANSIDDLVDKLIELGATPWKPDEDTSDDAENPPNKQDD